LANNCFGLTYRQAARYDSDVPEKPADQPYDPAAEYLTVAAAAADLGIQNQTLRTAIKDRRIPVVRLFGRVLVSRSSVEEYRARTQPKGTVQTGRPKKQE